MTRAQHFAKAKRWGIVAGFCLLVAIAAILMARASESPFPPLLGLLALLGVGVGVVSAGYRALMGLSRPTDWKPLAGEPLDRFEPEDEERSLRKRITQELGGRLTGEVRVQHENIVEDYPEDERSTWQKFVQSSDPSLPRYRFTFTIPTNTRQLVVNVWIGRSKKDPTPVRIRIVIEGDCRAALSTPLSWRDEFVGDPGAASILASNGELSKLVSGLVRRRVLSGGHWVFHPDPHLSVTPVEDSRTRVTLDTVEQDWKGGFVVKLGLDGFLTAVDQIENLLGDVSSATKNS